MCTHTQLANPDMDVTCSCCSLGFSCTDRVVPSLHVAPIMAWTRVSRTALREEDYESCQTREGMLKFAKQWVERRSLLAKPVVKAASGGGVSSCLYCREHDNCKQVSALVKS